MRGILNGSSIKHQWSGYEHIKKSCENYCLYGNYNVLSSLKYFSKVSVMAVLLPVSLFLLFYGNRETFHLLLVNAQLETIQVFYESLKLLHHTLWITAYQIKINTLLLQAVKTTCKKLETLN